MMNNLIKRKAFLAAFIVVVMATTLLLGIFNTNTMSVNATNLENLTVSEEHDNELKKFARMPLENNGTYSRNSVSGGGIFENNDFEYDRIEIILTKEHSNINGEVDYEYFSQVSNVKLITGSFHLVDTENINKDRFRQILTVELKEAGRNQVLEATSAFKQLDRVLIAQPVYIYEGGNDWTPNDTNFGLQWGMTSTNGLHAELAWNSTRGDADIQVGIFETGIQADHPDLRVGAGNFNSSATDHGTHVGGIIAAIINNSRGVAGVSNATLRILNRNTFRASLEWAASEGIRVVNSSYWQSRPTINQEGVVTADATANAINFQAIANYPGLFITSAGNQNLNNDINPQYPAAYNLPNLIAVGSIDSNGAKSSFSNFGANTVHIFAPGGDIYSTLSGGTYGYMSGTSMASPHVAGVVALLMAYNPYLSNLEIIDAILNNVDYDSDLDGFCVTGGRLNAYKALKSVYQTKEIINDFGYSGSTYYWNGAVNMHYYTDDVIDSSSSIKVMKNTQLGIELFTQSSSNAISTINGTVTFELKNSSGTSIQTHTSTVSVSILNNAKLNNTSFIIDTHNLENDTYTLTLVSDFERALWTDVDEKTYTIIVNTRSEKIITDFGYNTSWYKWDGKVDLNSSHLYSFKPNSSNQMIINKNTILNFTVGTESAYNAWFEIESSMTFILRDSLGNVKNIEGNSSHTATANVGLVSNVTYTNRSFMLNTINLSNDTYTLTLSNFSQRNGVSYSQTKIFTFIVEIPSCVAEGSLITLADGTQKAVETLTLEDRLLVWNMHTGQFDSAPILFIDSDAERTFEVINLSFSDGTTVKVIDEHGFWNVDLNQYVFLRNDASQYIGHWFNKQTMDEDGNMVWTAVQLTNVVIANEVTTSYSPVTYGHLNYYVNGMLSMPGATEGLINIFEVDASTMQINQEAYLADIEQYGLFTYEEFNAIIEVEEEVFLAFDGQYLKVAIGKGLITIEQIETLLARYIELLM